MCASWKYHWEYTNSISIESQQIIIRLLIIDYIRIYSCMRRGNTIENIRIPSPLKRSKYIIRLLIIVEYIEMYHLMWK